MPWYRSPIVPRSNQPRLSASERANRIFGKICRFNLRLRENSLNAWRAAAARESINVTDWITYHCDLAAIPPPAKPKAKQEVLVPPPVIDEQFPELDETCRHGKRIDELCYKCDASGIPEIRAS